MPAALFRGGAGCSSPEFGKTSAPRLDSSRGLAHEHEHGMANPLVGSVRGYIGRRGRPAVTGGLGSPAYRVLGPRVRIRAYKLEQKD